MPTLARFDPKHDIGIWLPLALADIYSILLLNAGAKEVPETSEIVNSWHLDNLSLALAMPTTKPHKQGGQYGGALAAMFASELK